MEFNKKSFDAFRKDVKEALAGVEKKYGVTVKPESINYGTVDFTLKLKAVNTKDGADASKVLFEKDCRWFGFAPDDYKKQFTNKNGTYELTGFRPKASKYTVTATKIEDGKSYMITEEYVKKAIGA